MESNGDGAKEEEKPLQNLIHNPQLLFIIKSFTAP
jgi:hypothetical protein